MSESGTVDGKLSNVSSWGISALLVAVFGGINGMFVWCDPSLQQDLLNGVRRFGGLERRYGFVKRTYHDSDGTRHSYMVFVPDPSLRAGRPPMVVYLNGHGENGDDCLAPLRNGLAPVIWEDELAFPFVVVWPQCDKNDQWVHGSRSSERALAIMRDMAEEFQTDPDRVYLTGISSGGTGAWAIAAGNPDLFTAIMPMSAEASASDVKKVIQAKLPVWSFFVSEDKQDLTDANRRVHQEMLQVGASSRSTELSIKSIIAKDEHDAWSFAFRDGGLYRWMISQTISGRQKDASQFDLVDLSSTPDSGRSESESHSDKLLRVHSTMSATPTLISVEQASIQSPTELHLEFRTTDNLARLGVGLFSSEGTPDKSGLFCDLACNDVSSSGLFSWPNRTCVQPAYLLAEHTFDNAAWNDLRVKVEQGHVSVELNGWSLLDHAPVALPAKDWKIGFVAQGESSAYADIRNLRIRRGDSDTSSTSSPSQPRSTAINMAEGVDKAPITSANLASVMEDWKRREQTNSKLEFTWRTADFDLFASKLSPVPAQQPIDPTQSSESRLRLDGDQIHYSTTWKHPRIRVSRKQGLKHVTGLQDYLRARASGFAPTSEQLTEALTLDVTIDETHRIDEVFDSEGRGHLGIVFEKTDVAKDRVGELDDLVWRGPHWAVHPNSGIGLQADKARIVSDSAWVSGVRCSVIEETTQHGGSTILRRIWVDPTRESLILRYALLLDGQLRELLDIQYGAKSSQSWLPVSWNAVTWPYASASVADVQFPGNERLFKAMSCQVIDDEPGRDTPRVTANDNFRPGTVVFDQRANEWFQQVSAGVRRKLNADEASEMAMNGRLANRDSASWRLYPIVGVGLVLLVGCWAGVRRVRRLR